MGYEKGEQIKSVEEFVKEVLSKDKPYYAILKNDSGEILYKKECGNYYSFNEGHLQQGDYFHAIPKKEKVKFWKFVDDTGRDTDRRYTDDLSKIYFGKRIDGSDEIRKSSATKFGWTKTNCFIEVEV